MLGSADFLIAQQDGVTQVGEEVQLFLERQYALGNLPGAFLTHQPLSRYEVQVYLDSLDTIREFLSGQDQITLSHYRGKKLHNLAKRVKGSRKSTFGNGRDFLSLTGEDFRFQFNPMLYTVAGPGSRGGLEGDANGARIFWRNTRGVRASGSIGKYLFFETRIEENQRIPGFPVFTNQTAPRQGVVKFDSTGNANPAYDYFSGSGLVGIRTKYFEIRFGRDKNHWGTGRGSVQLSNYAPVYDQLQLRTTVGKVQYTNLFSAFSDHTGLPDGEYFFNEAIPRKFGAFHRLAINVTKNLQVGLFETVIIGQDSAQTRSTYDFSYLNPVIFYRSVEIDRGGAGNAFIGGDVNWIVRPGLQFYGQFILDEFQLSQIRQPREGWWANKWSWLAGFHLVDPIPILPSNSSIRLEYTRSRPFTFSHRLSSQGYVHANDILAHPAGPNSEDIALFIHYRPSPTIIAGLNMAMTVRGRNPSTENLGGDPLIPYDEDRQNELGHRLLQGPQNQFLLEGHLSYELMPTLFAEAAVHFESIYDGENDSSWYLMPTIGLRWGVPFQSARY